MPETNLTSRIRYAISGISIRCYLYLNTSEIGINDHFLHFWSCKLPRKKLNQCRKLCRKLVSHFASGMPYPAYPLGTILYLDTQKTAINDHFIAFRVLRLLWHTLNQCRKLCRKLISHLAFGMHYPAFLSGAICT